MPKIRCSWQLWSGLGSGCLGPSGPSHTEKAPQVEAGAGTGVGWGSLLGWAFMGGQL